MLWSKPSTDIAKVGVEGSNPFARSRKPKEAQADKRRCGKMSRIPGAGLTLAFRGSG